MNQRTVLFEQMPVPKAVMSLAVPTIISSLVMVIYNMADTYFVGLLNDPIQTAAVTLATPVLLAFYAISNLFGVGTSSVMSRALGQKDHTTVKKASAIGVYGSIISAAAFSVLVLVLFKPLLSLLGADVSTAATTRDYLYYTVVWGAVPSIANIVFAYLVRSEGSAFHASLGTMSGAILNIILDPFFILPWGLNMGAAGAGLATLISNIAAMGYYIILIRWRADKTLVSINPKDFSLNRNLWQRIASVGIPASIQNLLNVTGLTILNNFTAVYGADAVAAMGIATKIQWVPFQIAIGASQGVMPLVSYNYGNDNRPRMKQTILYILKWMGLFMVSVFILGAIFSRPIIGLFMSNPEVIRYGSVFLTGLLMAMPFLGIDFVAVGVFQAIGDGKKALLFAVLRKIIFEIPGLFILNYLFGIYGLVYAQVIAEIVLALIALQMLRRIMRLPAEAL